MVYWLSFIIGDNEHNSIVRDKIRKFKENIKDEDTIVSCHLNADLIKQADYKAYDTNYFLKEVFGDKYICLTKGTNLSQAEEYVKEARLKAKDMADILVVIESKDLFAVEEDISLFNDKIKYL